ncbi:MAG: ABC transporter permease [Caldilinea sp.]|uniref:ABC transporter permease n=1 Tax=Caldilinea sp. TaxID=2293560 RepID=UPI002C7C8573|nr:ABC transporter permease [Anaerolineales bacterium]HQY93660.1 ABC transporter permease [Caldilinea sp.]
MFFRRYLIPRFIQYFLVIFFGVTAVFIIPRLLPNDPVMRTIAELRARGASLEPGAMDKIIADMTQMYGLEGTWLDQYGAFWTRLMQGDLGVSFFQFPTPVSSLILTALPWTVGLLLTTTIFAWVIGNVLGAFAGYYSSSRWAQGMDAVAMVIRPMPYYIFAFALLLLFAYAVRWFPVSGGSSFGRQPSFTLPYIQDVLWHSFLPALSIAILGMAVWFQTMKLVVQSVVGESYVQYARLGGVTERKIVTRYVFRNALLPQITGLALSLGLIFSGALITEIVFSYPGLGTLLYRAIINGDYNLIMGITVFSIFAITTTVLIVDLLYPLFDPRIRYS